jgi:hypothetical protein
MECGHVDASAPQHSLFGDAILAKPDVLGGSGNNVHEEALMLFVGPGKKAADRIDSFVLLFEKRAQIGFGATRGKVIHTGSDLRVNTGNG